MDRCLLDTDTLSEVLKGRDPIVVAAASAYRSQFGRYTTSTVTVLEVVKGWRKLGRDDRVDEFIEHIENEEILDLDVSSATIAGRIYGDLERTGQPIGRADPMIAAIAIDHGLPLATGNSRHYQRIIDLGHDLTLVNWRDESGPV